VSRGQSHVVGIVLLLGITTIALGGLTAVVGSIVDGQTAAADEARVASTLDSDLRPVEQSGPGELRVQFTEGRLATVQRDFRILNDSAVVRSIEAGGLVYTSGSGRVGYAGGAVVRGQPGEAWLVSQPPVTVTRDNSTLVVGAVRLNASGQSVGGSGGVTARLATNVSHRHTHLANDSYRVAIETATPEPFARALRERGLTTTVTDLDGDGVDSVVADVPGQQELELVVHETNLEVANG
jgi:hypothetical protein